MRELPVHDRWALAVKPARFWDPLPGGGRADEGRGGGGECFKLYYFLVRRRLFVNHCTTCFFVSFAVSAIF